MPCCLRMTLGFNLIIFLVVYGGARSATGAYNILLMPLPAKSHVYTMLAIADELQHSGHRATILLTENFPLTPADFQQNRSEIRIVRYADHSETGSSFQSDEAYVKLTTPLMEQSSADGSFLGKLIRDVRGVQDEKSGWMLRLKTLMYAQCRELLMNNDDLLEQLSQESFHMAAVDGAFSVKFFFVVPHRLGIPSVNVALYADPWYVRTPWLPSFVPNLATSFSERMSFTERLQNLITNVALHRLNTDLSPDVFAKYQKYGSFNDLDELLSRSLLYLYVHDPVLDYPRPMMPNMVNVGGLTIKRTVDPLPTDVETFIEEAERGVIVVSFGTLASVLPRRLVEKFVSVFRRLDGYRIVWKIQNRDNVTLPDNVMTMEWLPQNDILAHRSVRLFLTHCGNNGQFEAVYHGVPMIGFPMLGDQLWNARRIEYKGYGKWFDIASFTSDELYRDIRTILDDQLYAERVKKASEIYRSRPQSAAERAVYWIEHVCKFGGEHLRSAGNDLPLYAYLMLDIAFVLLLLLAFSVSIYCLVAFAIRRCRLSKSYKAKLQ